MDEPLIRSASLTGFADLARSFGLDPYRLVAAQGIPASALSNPDLKIPGLAVARIYERAAEAAGAPDFGLRLAETRRLSNLGAFGLVLREQPTLRKAIEAAISNLWTLSQGISLRFDVFEEFALVQPVLVAPGVRAAAGPQTIDLVLGILVRTLRGLVGEGWTPREVMLRRPPPGDLATHRRVFGVAPRFEQEFDAIVMDARDLERPIAGADPEAARRALRYLELEAGAAQPAAADAVRELVIALLPTGGCTIARVAAHMGISRRTLHRRLAETGAPTFTEILKATRRELAERYMTDGRHSLTEIGDRLGYGSLSAFSRWRRNAKAGP